MMMQASLQASGVLQVCWYISLGEHPFNLKGGGGGYGFFGVKIFLRFVAQQNFFSWQVITTFFFYKNNIFLRHEVLIEYFFLPISETDFFSSIKYADRMFFLKKPIKWVLPYIFLPLTQTQVWPLWLFWPGHSPNCIAI